LCWDAWNESDNANDNSYAKQELKNKVELVTPILPQVFRWVREEQAQQTIAVGL
jgi:hypothetical protein